MDMWGFESAREYPGQEAALLFGITAATAGTISAVAAGVGAATSLASGIYKMVSSNDQRPSLGEGSLGEGAAQSIAQSYGRAVSQNPGLTMPPITGLGRIEQNLNRFGQRLGMPTPAPAPQVAPGPQQRSTNRPV